MSEPSVKPSASQPVKDKRLMKATFMLVLYSLGLIGVLAAAGYFGYRLFHGPQAKPMTEIAPPKKVIPAFSTILATSAPAPELPKQIQVTLAQMAKVEAAKQGRPGGPLYDPASGNVAMFFEKLPLRDPQVAEAQSVLAKYLQAATWRERLPYIFEPERVKALMQVQYEKRGQKDPEHEALLAAGLITAGTSKMLNLQFATPPGLLSECVPTFTARVQASCCWIGSPGLPGATKRGPNSKSSALSFRCSCASSPARAATTTTSSTRIGAGWP